MGFPASTMFTTKPTPNIIAKNVNKLCKGKSELDFP